MATFLKMENGWKDLESDEFYQFGQITINFLNYYDRLEREYLNKLESAQTNDERKKVDEEYADFLDAYNSSHALLSAMRSHVTGIGYGTTDFQPIKKFTLKNDSHISEREQTKNYEYRLELAQKQGWRDIEYGVDFNIIDAFLMKALIELNENNPLSAMPHFINGKWYMAYDSKDDNRIVILDIIEIREVKHNIRYCRNCDSLYIQKYKKQKYCVTCSANYKKIADANRKQSPRYKHKQIQNYLKNSQKFTLDEMINFNTESDFYWDKIAGKTAENNKNYRTDITTASQYIAWLEEKHEEFKRIAKTRKKITPI